MAIPKTERELLNACFARDREAWERFVEAYSKLVYYSIHQTYRVKGFVPQAEEVEDLYGNVFLSLFEDNFARLRSFRGKNDCTLASWLRLIASRKTLDHLRERGRHLRVFDVGGAQEAAPLHNFPDQDDIEKATLDGERRELLRKAFLQLSPDDMTFLHLCFEQELPPERIAEILGVTVSTVYSKKNRVREKIKSIIEEM